MIVEAYLPVPSENPMALRFPGIAYERRGLLFCTHNFYVSVFKHNREGIIRIYNTFRKPPMVYITTTIWQDMIASHLDINDFDNWGMVD